LRFDKQFPISVMELVLQGRLSRLPWYGFYSTQDKKAAEEALERVGMAHLADRPFGSLSGGQAQRVLIARALASAPRLLLLDEPTASVDARAEAEIYSILRGLQGEITILMVTHNLQAAIELVDSVICIQQTAQMLDPKQVCEHYAMGLYHSPLMQVGTKERDR
jgi:zinc transport system ATP-binding protein